MPFDEEELDPHGECRHEIGRLKEALKLALLRMRGVAMEHKTNGRPDLAEVTQRWAQDIEAAVTQ